MKCFRLAAVLLALLLAVPAQAQISSATGAVQGTVTDPSGALIADAKVTLVNVATGSRSESKTQSDGTYVFPLVTPGNYQVEVESSGFRRSVSRVIVEITKVSVANIKLELGEVTSEMVVTDAVLTVDTASATTGDVISGAMIRAIPLPTRNFLDLTGLQAGVAATMGNPAALGRGAPQLFVAGQRGTVNNFVLNGVDANNFGNNNLANVPVPNPDAVQEFRVSTSQYDATQGRGSGGNINVVIRSGQKDLHGTGFWFYRSDALNANDFFLNRAGRQKPVLLQNQAGGNLGGPVWGLEETFWFFSYQAMRQKNGVAGVVTGAQPVIPTMRDAATLAAAFGIPAASIDPVALAWVNRPGPYDGLLYPSGTGAAVGSVGSFAISQPSFFNEDQYTASFDRELFRNNRFGYRMFYSKVAQTNPVGGGVALGQGQDNPQRNTHMAVSDTWAFTSTLFNEFRAGFTLIKNKTQADEGTTIGDIGMSRFNSAFFNGTPAVFFNDGTLSWGGISTNNDQASQTLSGTVGNTLSWTRGKHTVRGGAEWRRYHVNLFNHFASRGFLVFANFADFLQGAPDDVFVGTGITDRGFRAWDMAMFVQDDYRLLSRLTLNLGLRYEYLGPSIDIRDRLGNFDPSLLTSACLQTAGNCLRDGFVSPEGLGGGFGTPGVSHSTYLNLDKNNFAPRLGLAWDVMGNGKLAVRSGYGIYYIRTSNQTLLQLLTAAPFFQLSRQTGTNIIGTQALANPFPTLPTPDQFPRMPIFPQFSGFSGGVSTNAPIFVDPANPGTTVPLLTINPFERNHVAPYNQNWNLTVQYEFLPGFTAEVGYIGSRGINLLASRQINQALLRNANNPGLGGVTSNSVANASARVAVPGFSATGLNAVLSNGDSYYHGLIFSVRHPMRRGLDFKVDYTLSKSLDTNSGAAAQDLGNAGGNQLLSNLSKGLSIFDQKHRLVFTYLWRVPGPTSGWLEKAAGGWELSGVSLFQSGMPLTVTSSSSGASLAGFAGSGLSFSDRVCNGGFTAAGDVNNSLNNYVILACFANPTPVTGTISNLSPNMGPGTETFTVVGTGTLFGNGARGLARAPFQQRFDFALTKRFKMEPLYSTLGEGANLEFRAEFFKLFNTPIFANPLVAGTINLNRDSAGTFGRINSTIDGTGRIIQFALKLNF